MNAMDFDDLLVRAVNAMELFEEVRARYAAAFRYVLVDEYQDTNHAQYRWLQLIAGGEGHRNLAVVGDDDQCLIEGTLVTMGDGSVRPIEEVRVGDEVLSSFGSGDMRPARVRRSGHTARRASHSCPGRRIVSTPEHMHFAGYRLGLREDLTVTLCGGGRAPVPGHTVTIAGRAEESFTDFGAAVRFAALARGAGDAGSVGLVARMGAPVAGMKNSLPFMTAASVRPGMAMFTEEAGYDIVESVERVELDRPVHDLNVEGTHNFVAAGLVTHNSVYSFRGADITNILNFQDDYPDAEVVRLEQELPLDADDPQRRQRGDHPQPRADGQVAVDGPGRGRPGQGARARGRARRGALRGGRDRAARRRGRLARGDRDLLPDQRAVAGARGHARARARSATRSSAARSSTSAPRSRTRSPT